MCWRAGISIFFFPSLLLFYIPNNHDIPVPPAHNDNFHSYFTTAREQIDIMKQGRFNASLLLLASIAAWCAAVPLNGTTSIARRMDPDDMGPEEVVNRMGELHSVGGCWINYMIMPVLPNMNDVRDLAMRHVLPSGWSRNDRTGERLPPPVQEIHKLDGVQGLRQMDTHPTPPVSLHRAGWVWAELDHNRRYLYDGTQEPPAGWSFHGLYNRHQRAIVITRAYGKDINTTPYPLPPTHDQFLQRPPGIYEWSQLTWMEFRKIQMREHCKPIRTAMFPALEGTPEDVYFFRYAGNRLRNSNVPLPPKPGFTFPIGSYGHQLLLGTPLGQQMSRLMYENKHITDPSVIVAIHVWDSGAPGGMMPTVVFSAERYDARIRDMRQANLDAGGDEPMFNDWPHKFLPNFVRRERAPRGAR
ncbi:hypothetical protein CLAFUW4_12218 [Fulvia fulva]|uniref:Uncharacterized protein n=1 Tax=Passalora fulva TaxID=5499 RepID=A0A9Q8PEC3_PASFU|nr:uncharacterized protein CLAFUR5_11248 [Fulvia fulva]KAK4618349.1 hypothetical protein CLAFUR4_12223 [Fulvia fulva]KAK4619154.1 hypothetical protein CLAFUR0_12234 [Fulvia fulva]UJO20857.1 hypothetical protein CLAFUR5_11248 [Fulvia fulva]WPV17843.1 hypothetical protein CLAFUW4_12218 [Fulvia fulva]WPV33284.1 hypothetical protein CLAFUW7_12225 [Fulvia fulva]